MKTINKHLGLLLVVFAVIFSFFVVVLPVHAKKTVAKKPNAPAAKVEQTPQEPCKAFVVMEAASGKILEELNMHERRPPASMTKLMVAYIVLEKIAKGEIKLTDMVHVSPEASRIGGSQVYLKENEEFSLEDMMRAIMIASANDAAHAVSELVAGSNTGFVALMNEKAKALGMNDTEFASVHGLPPGTGQKEDLTSCYDMAVLARGILKYPKIIEWTSTKMGEFRGGAFTLNNHNKLLSRMPEVDGLKTGYYSSTGFNVAATAKRGDLRFITVVMGSPSGKVRDGLVAEKFKKYFAEYTVLNVAKKGTQVEKEVILEDGKYRKLKGVAAADLNLTLMRGQKNEIKRVVSLPASIKGEVREGQKLGEVLFQLDNQTVGKVDIVSPVYVPKANIFTRMVRKTGLNL
jgi:serine-type D-Ala-D-Ala carboxypeptidase (penicillin-binding protein 5/6)